MKESLSIHHWNDSLQKALFYHLIRKQRYNLSKLLDIFSPIMIQRKQDFQTFSGNRYIAHNILFNRDTFLYPASSRSIIQPVNESSKEITHYFPKKKSRENWNHPLIIRHPLPFFGPDNNDPCVEAATRL